MTMTFIYSLGLLSIFLLIGVILRAKIKLLQNLFLPASVIGGFLLLMLPVNKEYISIYSKIPISYSSYCCLDTFRISFSS